MNLLERYFRPQALGSTVRTEIVAGITTFVTMAYILFVNPQILAQAGLNEAAVLTSTALVAGVTTILMGAITRYPFALASGMGLNAFVAFTLVASKGLTPAEAMGAVVFEGLLILILVVAGFREKIMDAIPMPLKTAISVGIGLFIAFVGFANAGFVIKGEGTLLTLGHVDSTKGLIFVGAVILVFALTARRVKGALLIAIVAATVVGIAVNEIFYGGQLWRGSIGTLPGLGNLVSLPDFSLVGNVSFGFFSKIGFVGGFLAIFSLMMSDFFDSIGSVLMLGAEGNFLRPDDTLPRMKSVMILDSVAAMAGGVASSSSATIFVESSAGIAEGGRTGLASIVTGIIFLLALFISPIAGIIPPEAPAAALVLVGFLMMQHVRLIDWRNVVEAAPAFLTIIGIPLTYSITSGIGMGFISYTLLMTMTGQVRKVKPLMWIASAAFLLDFASR